jgi:cytochrome c-type biogenesis protein CcmH/NrfF
MSRAVRAVAFGFALLAGLASSSDLAAAPDAATQYQVETDLTCQCGCGLTVHSCNHLNCGSAIPLKKEIGEQIASGKSRTDILSYFEQKYGEKILSSPTTRGFNIAAWTVPFIALAIGGALVAFVLSRWRRATVARVAPAVPGTGTLDPTLRERLDSELRDFDRRS